MKQGCLWLRASKPQSRLSTRHREPEFAEKTEQGDGLHGEEHMQATVCKWKSNRLPLPIMKCEAGVVSVSQISARFIFIEAASSCKVLANRLLAGRRGEGSGEDGASWGGHRSLSHLLGGNSEWWRWSSRREK